MSEEPKPGEDAAGYWHEWEWCPEYSLTTGGYWEATYSLRIYPSEDGRYSVSAGGAWLPERPDTFRAAEDFAVDADQDTLRLAAERDALAAKLAQAEASDAESMAMFRRVRDERDALREEVRRLREALERIAVTAHRGRDWMQAHARAALAERPEGQEVGG